MKITQPSNFSAHKKKLYWNTAMFIYFSIVYGHFSAIWESWVFSTETKWLASKNIYCLLPFTKGLPRWSVVNNQSANAGDVRDVGLIPGLGRSPGVGNGNPLQCSCLKIPMDRGALWSTDHGVAKSKTQLMDWEHTHTLLKSWPTPGLDGEVLGGCQAQAGGLWSRIAANDKFLKLGVLSGLEGASLVAQTGKNSPAVLETHVQSLGREDPLEKEMATHSIYLPGEFRGQRNLVGCHPWGHKSQARLSD